MKKISNLLIAIWCSVPTVAATVIPTTSCSETRVTKIDVKNKLQTNSTTSFLFPFTMSHVPLTPVHVKILGDSTGFLSLEENIIDLKVIKKNGTIKVNISDLCTKSTKFNFKIQFWFTNLLKQEEKIIVDGFTIYYNYAPEVKTDQVRVKRRLVERTNGYQFDFVLQFSALPSSVVFIDVFHEKTRQLYIPGDITTGWEVQQEDDQYLIHLPVNLDRTQAETQAYVFSLQILFVNSYGLGQEVILDNLVASFIYKPNEILPSDFFEYKTAGGKVVLTGINKEVADPEKTFPSYHTIIIPEGVHEIGIDAISDKKLFSHITKIVFPQSLQYINDGALRGCVNVQEIDLTASESFIPNWMLNDSHIFGDLGANPICEAGNVWIADEFNRVTINNLLQNNLHLPSLWKSFSDESIMPDECFNIEGTKLVSINIDYLHELKKYQVVKIPSRVTELGENCLRLLGYYPALNLDSKSDDDMYTSRRLVLHENIEKIDTAALMEANLGGPLCISCPKLEEISDDAFNQCSETYLAVEARSGWTYEKLYISFVNSDKLTTIGARAFSDSAICGTIDLPVNLITIKDKSFCLDCKHSSWINEMIGKLVIHQNLTNVEGECGLSYMEHLSSMDLSEFATLPQWALKGSTNHIFKYDGSDYWQKGKIICATNMAQSWKNVFESLGANPDRFDFVEIG